MHYRFERVRTEVFGASMLGVPGLGRRLEQTNAQSRKLVQEDYFGKRERPILRHVANGKNDLTLCSCASTARGKFLTSSQPGSAQSAE